MLSAVLKRWKRVGISASAGAVGFPAGYLLGHIIANGSTLLEYSIVADAAGPGSAILFANMGAISGGASGFVAGALLGLAFWDWEKIKTLALVGMIGFGAGGAIGYVGAFLVGEGVLHGNVIGIVSAKGNLIRFLAEFALGGAFFGTVFAESPDVGKGKNNCSKAARVRTGIRTS